MRFVSPRALQFVLTLTVLIGCCLIYQITLVAWMEPLPLPSIKMAGSPALRADDSLGGLFPPDAWQLGNCKRLQTRDGLLLFENWQQMSDDQWRLWPVTIIIGTRRESPLVLEAQQGAEIKFTESLDVMSGGAPPIERGRLVGEVQIFNVDSQANRSGLQSSSANSERRLMIKASEVGIDFRKIWTTAPIEMRMGEVTMRGRDLTLHLATTAGMRSAGDSAFSVLDHVELIYLDDLSMPLAPGGLWAKQKPLNQASAAISSANTVVAKAPIVDSQGTTIGVSNQRPMPIGKHPVPIGRSDVAGTPGSGATTGSTAVSVAPGSVAPGLARLKCGGRVVFHFTTSELTLQDQVELQHQAHIDSPLIDSFRCDFLRLRLADIASERERGDRVQDYLLSLFATGRPAEMVVPSMTAKLLASQIEFDTRANLVHLSGQSGVLVNYGGTRWRFSDIKYLLNPSDPQAVGTFDALGPGMMESIETAQLPVQKIVWTDGAKFEQLGAPDQFELRVDGDIKATTTDGGSFECEAAQLILVNQNEKSLTPKSFQAKGQVRMKTSFIEVATSLLQLYFEIQPDPKPTAPTDQAADQVAAQGLNPIRNWIKQPGEASSSTQLASRSTPIAPPRPRIHGDTITARLEMAAGNVTTRDLKVVGNVSLHHEIETQSGRLPATMTGDRLTLSDGGTNDVLNIGSGVNGPARFHLGDGYFIGPFIQVRLADNAVWIKDAGEFQMPTQVLPQVGMIRTGETTEITSNASAEPQRPQRIQWLAAPRCAWEGEMYFDGHVATLTHGVKISATLAVGAEGEMWELQMVGDQLQMSLDKNVQLRDVASVKSATIDQVTLASSQANPLFVTANQLTAAGQVKARHVLNTPSLVMKPQTGTMTGAGPGWYRVWMLANPDSVFDLRSDASQRSMHGAHLVYQESLNVSLNDQSLDFNKQVRIGTRAVGSFDEIVDVNQMQGLRLGESLLDCERLRLSVDMSRSGTPAASAWEMEASGGLAFQTRNERGLFSGTADRGSYAAAKDLFLMDGAPGRSAVFSQTLPTGQPGGSATVKHMAINPKTMEIESIEFDRLQLGNQPMLNKLTK